MAVIKENIITSGHICKLQLIQIIKAFTLSRTSCPSLSPVRTNSLPLPSGSKTTNLIFPLSNGVFSKETEKSQMQQLSISGLQENFFQVHNKNMFESCLDRLSPGHSQSADRKPKRGYQAAKLAGPDITFQFQPEMLSKTHVTQSSCNKITLKSKHIYIALKKVSLCFYQSMCILS